MTPRLAFSPPRQAMFLPTTMAARYLLTGALSRCCSQLSGAMRRLGQRCAATSPPMSPPTTTAGATAFASHLTGLRLAARRARFAAAVRLRRPGLSLYRSAVTATCNGIKENSIPRPALFGSRELRRRPPHHGLGAVMRQLIELPEEKMIVHGQCPDVGAGLSSGGWHTTCRWRTAAETTRWWAWRLCRWGVGAPCEESAPGLVGPCARPAPPALATRIVVQTFDVPADLPTDSGDPFVIHEPGRNSWGS